MCLLLVAAIAITQNMGCAQVPHEEPWSRVWVRQPVGEARPELASREVLLFGRVELTEVGHPPADLSFDTALYLVLDDTPATPIPLWAPESLGSASIPLSPSKDGRFQFIAAARNYKLQLVYRSQGAAWFAIDPEVHIRAEDASGAMYIGDLRVVVDPQKIARKQDTVSTSSSEAVHIEIVDDFEAEHALAVQRPGYESLAVSKGLLSPYGDAKPSAVFSPPKDAKSGAATTEKESVAVALAKGVGAIVLLAILVPVYVFFAVATSYR